MSLPSYEPGTASSPSLLPRGGIVQGLVWGITAAIGYGLGVLAAWIWRAFADREPRRPRHRSWPVFFIGAGVLVVVSFGLGQLRALHRAQASCN